MDDSSRVITDSELDGIVLSDWYSQSQIKELASYHINTDWRMQITRWRKREGIHWRKLCSKRSITLYLRRSVNMWLRGYDTSLRFSKKQKLEELILRQATYPYCLGDWIPACYALARWEKTYEHFFALSVRTGFPSINVIRVPEFKMRLYSYDDMRRWEHAANNMSTKEFLRWEKENKPQS